MTINHKSGFSVLAISISLALFLSACQPANDIAKMPVVEEGASVGTTEADATAIDPMLSII
ncbi:hypothetical protein Psyaliredsea_20600 [Psychrobacter alimentarius]